MQKDGFALAVIPAGGWFVISPGLLGFFNYFAFIV